MSSCEFEDVYPDLKRPFVLNQAEMEEGTLFVPRRGFLEIMVYERGTQVKHYARVKYPSASQLSSGFDESTFVTTLGHLKCVMNPLISIEGTSFGEIEHEVRQNGEAWETSTNTTICSTGAQDGWAYFDLVVMSRKADDSGNGSGMISHVNYSECTSSYDTRTSSGDGFDGCRMSHSGDQSQLGNLVHEVTFHGDDSSTGLAVLVGYNHRQLKKWYGQSVGLFIVDKTNRKSTFVPLDLSEMTVRNNETIVPIMFKRGAQGMKWFIPEIMKTGIGDTRSAHNDQRCPARDMLLHFNTHFAPDIAFEQPSPSINTPSSVLTGVEDLASQLHISDEPTMAPNDGRAAQVCMSLEQSQLISALSGVRPYYFLRSFGEESPTDADADDLAGSGCFLPFLFGRETIQGKLVALYKWGYSSSQVQMALSSRPLVVHVDASKGIDSTLLRGRGAGMGDVGVTRLNCVFIVHVNSLEEISKANMSVVSFYAGPRATVVYRVEVKQTAVPEEQERGEDAMQEEQRADGGGGEGGDTPKTRFVYLLSWATPSSVIPAAMTNALNPEIADFEDKLGEYLGSTPPSDCLVSYDDSNQRDVAISLPDAHGSVTFNTLEPLLERTKDLHISERMQVVQHLFAFEYVLGRGEMQQVQSLLRKHYKSVLTSEEKIAFFKKVQEEGASPEDRQKIVTATKTMEKTINLFSCRRFLTVNEFFTAFQEKKAEHGEKAAAKMDLGLACQDFVKKGDISTLIGEFDDFTIARVNAPAISRFLSDFCGGNDAVVDRVSSVAGAPVATMAVLDGRTPALDGVTVDCMVSLGLSHELQSQGSVPFAIPTMQRQAIVDDAQEEAQVDAFDGYPSDQSYVGEEDRYQSLVFLPVFTGLVPDNADFNVACWAYSLVSGFKNCTLYPRDLAYVPRAVEYAVLCFLVSLLEKLCAMRSAPVTSKEDVESDLVRRIRSVYWLIRNVMLMNVSAMTPEPICSVLTGGTLNHRVELELGLRVLRCMPFTGVPRAHREAHATSLTSILLRIMYNPYAEVFTNLAKASQNTRAQEVAAVGRFYDQAEEADKAKVTARVRPKICYKCNSIQTKHMFPREKQFLVVEGRACYRADLDRKTCFGCQDLTPATAPMMCARKGRCVHPDKGSGTAGGDPSWGYVGPYTDFAVVSTAATCHRCMDALLAERREANGEPPEAPKPSRKRKVPPQYYPMVGKEVPEGRGVQALGISAVVVPDLYRSEDTILDETSSLPLCGGDAAGASQDPKDPFKSQSCSLAQLVGWGRALGMFTSPSEAQASGGDVTALNKTEILGIYNLMVLRHTHTPAWKAAQDDIQAGQHRRHTASRLPAAYTIRFAAAAATDTVMITED